MLVFRGIPARSDAPTVLTIGNFDGVHRGHQALLERLVGHARRLGLPAAVMTFEPHPREFFAPDSAPARLSALREKLALLKSAGVDRVYICRFDARIAALTAQEFIDRVLVQGLSVRHLIIGDDFRFGRGRGGDFALLQAQGAARGFAVEAMHTIDFEGERVSSSAVREALAAGEIEHAIRLLGRPYAIAGRVVHGDKRGRQLGFPTANVQLKRNRPPLLGVFAVRLLGAGERTRAGVANLGFRPTVGDSLRASLEVHLFDFDADLYCAHVTVNFLHRLRGQIKFDGLDALKAQITRDASEARAYFDAHPIA